MQTFKKRLQTKTYFQRASFITSTSQSQPHSSASQTGFTLIEVMVALAILALLSMVASQTSGTYLKSVENLKLRTLAHFVAHNEAAQLQINSKLPLSNEVNKVTSQGREWQVSVTPQPIDIFFTKRRSQVSNLHQMVQPILIQVAPIDSETSKVQYNIADLTTMLSKNDVTVN